MSRLGSSSVGVTMFCMGYKFIHDSDAYSIYYEIIWELIIIFLIPQLNSDCGYIWVRGGGNRIGLHLFSTKSRDQLRSIVKPTHQPILIRLNYSLSKKQIVYFVVFLFLLRLILRKFSIQQLNVAYAKKLPSQHYSPRSNKREMPLIVIMQIKREWI